VCCKASQVVRAAVAFADGELQLFFLAMPGVSFLPSWNRVFRGAKPAAKRPMQVSAKWRRQKLC